MKKTFLLISLFLLSSCIEEKPKRKFITICPQELKDEFLKTEPGDRMFLLAKIDQLYAIVAKTGQSYKYCKHLRFNKSLRSSFPMNPEASFSRSGSRLVIELPKNGDKTFIVIKEYEKEVYKFLEIDFTKGFNKLDDHYFLPPFEDLKVFDKTKLLNEYINMRTNGST